MFSSLSTRCSQWFTPLGLTTSTSTNVGSNTSASLWTRCPGGSTGLSLIARTLRGLWPGGEPASKSEKISKFETGVRGAVGEYCWMLDRKVSLRDRRGNNFHAKNLVDRLRANDRTRNY